MQELSDDQLKMLAQKMLTGTITPEEQQLLEQWLNAHPGNAVEWQQTDASEAHLKNRLFASILKDSGAENYTARKRTFVIYWAAAASILLLISAGIYFLLPTKKLPVEPIAKVVQPEILLPGSDKAILTLGDGRQIKLEGQKTITDGGLQIKNENNELVYSASDVVSMNTMTTPRGGQYQVRLPDGSKVWLNASSSITYPTAFKGSERRVALKGEGYFEIAKNPTMPFIVHSNDMDIKVLGTHFNVMAYDDESTTKTTLLEGAVQINSASKTAVLKPGQEASFDNTANKIKINKADVEQATAWKNGLFVFNRTDVRSIMRQLSRWYDFDVRYETSFENKYFSGIISRNTELKQVLNMLQMTQDVHFRIEGKSVIVLP